MTVVDFEYTNTKYMNDGSAWYNINPNTHIDVGGRKFTLTNAEGVSIAPQKTYFHKGQRKAAFRLYFPPLPEGTTRFDFIETDESPWRILGIQLK